MVDFLFTVGLIEIYSLSVTVDRL